mgnify:CR=1 FL=1
MSAFSAAASSSPPSATGAGSGGGSYVPRTDTYIEKDASINEQIDRMRHSATRSLLERDDVIIVASVSCIYGIGSVETYTAMTFTLNVGDQIDEAKLRAEQTAAATRKGLESLGGELADDQRGAIESALAVVESLLAKRGRDEAVTAAELKEANGNLDDATQPLAELMMDRVMAEMLEKRGVLPG